MNGFSNIANDEVSETFAAMFPDSYIAKSFIREKQSQYTHLHMY